MYIIIAATLEGFKWYLYTQNYVCVETGTAATIEQATEDAQAAATSYFNARLAEELSAPRMTSKEAQGTD